MNDTGLCVKNMLCFGMDILNLTNYRSLVLEFFSFGTTARIRI